MVVYILLYVLIVSFSLLYTLELIKVKDLVVILPITLFMVFIAGFRHEVGNDWGFYKYLYNAAEVHSILHSGKAEPSFQVLLLFFKFSKLGFQSFLFFVALVSIGLKSAFVLKYSSIPILSFLVLLSFFLIGEMGQVRQMLAIAICLWSVPAIIEKKLFKFLLLTTLAATFHYSAFSFLFLYPVYWLKWNKSLLVITVSVVVLLGVFSWFGLLPKIVQYAPNYIQHKFNVYYTPNNIVFKEQTLWYRIIFVVLSYFTLKDVNNPVVDLSLKIYVFGILFLILFAPIETVSGRGTLYFKIFEIILVPQIIFSLKHKKIFQMAVLSFFIVYHSRHFLVGLYDYGELYLPYKSVIF